MWREGVLSLRIVVRSRLQVGVFQVIFFGELEESKLGQHDIITGFLPGFSRPFLFLNPGQMMVMKMMDRQHLTTCSSRQ